MRFSTTLILLILAAGGAAGLTWLNWRDARHLGRSTSSESLRVLDKDVTSDRLPRVEISHDKGGVQLFRTGTAWNLPGEWPTRKPEVAELIDLITGLRSRFEPVPLGELKDFG